MRFSCIAQCKCHPMTLTLLPGRDTNGGTFTSGIVASGEPFHSEARIVNTQVSAFCCDPSTLEGNNDKLQSSSSCA